MNEYINTTCPHCGELFLPGDLFCSKCGYKVNLINTSLIEEQYIANNTQYYSNKFFEMRVVNKQTSWNWTAFLWPAYWCIYRKMYFYGFGILLLQYVLRVAYVGGNFINVAIGIAFGIYANNIYMQRIERLVRELNYIQEPLKQHHVDKHSGVNPAALIAVIIGTFCLALAIELL